MASKTGWLEKWHKGRVASIAEVQYHRVKVAKTPRKKKGLPPSPAQRHTDLYYMLDKKIKLGQLSLTGGSVFTQKEVVEVELPMTRYRTRFRLLGKITKSSTFMEFKRVVFRGEVDFVAVNKEDFDHLAALEDRRRREEAPAPSAPASKSHLKVTFKRG